MSAGLLLFAMDGLMSRLCLENLLCSSVKIKGIALPANSAITNKPISVIQKNSIEWIAEKQHIPVFYIQQKNKQSYQDAISLVTPELILVACFPYRLPESVFNFPVHGSYNIHPSLLPAYRGPVPLFWQFYDGKQNTGISIHRIEQTFDSGEIVLQTSVPFPDGIDTLTAIQLMVESIKTSLPEVIKSIFSNRIKKIKQDESKSSYYSWPKKESFCLDNTWDVQRVYNFMCGTSHWNQLYRVTLGQHEYLIRNAVSCKKQRNTINKPVRKDHLYQIPFDNGCLYVNDLIK